MAGERTSVYAMVNQVIADSREIAAEESFGLAKTASAEPKKKEASTDSHKVANKHTSSDLMKLANACDVLAKNIHLVNDERTPQEKLAEYAATHEAVVKMAESGDVDPNKQHQTQKSNPDSDPPSTVSPDSSGTGVGGTTAIPSEETNTPGTSMDAGESGEASGGHQSPQSVSPTEKANPQDAANALETNKGMMIPEQPEDLVRQTGGEQSTGTPSIGKTAAKMKRAMVLVHKARKSGMPDTVTRAFLKIAGLEKEGEDALNPASISGSTNPILQSEAAVPSALSQGSEAGSNTPRGSAPTSGEASGRELISSNEAAINATKGQAKTQNNRSALQELLTEPAMSSANDKVLSQSLDNTSSAGVKISAAQANAARTLLQKFASTSPEQAQKVNALLKLAMDPNMAAGGGSVPPAGGDMTAVPDDEVPAVAPPAEGMPPMEGGIPPEGGMPPMEGGMPPGMEGGMPGMEEGGVPSDEALEAAKSGVTPEELAAAEALLAQQGEMAAAMGGGEEVPPPQEAAPPEAGGDEKASQMGGMSSPPMT